MKRSTQKRDGEIFKRLKAGETPKEIAHALHITTHVIYDARRRKRGAK